MRDLRDGFADLAVVDELLGGGQLAGIDQPLDVGFVDRHPLVRLLYQPFEPILQAAAPPPRGKRAAALATSASCARTAARLRRCRGSSWPLPVRRVRVGGVEHGGELAVLLLGDLVAQPGAAQLGQQLHRGWQSVRSATGARRSAALARRPVRARLYGSGACRTGPQASRYRAVGYSSAPTCASNACCQLRSTGSDELVDVRVGRARVTRPRAGLHDGPGHLEQLGG